MKQNIYIFGSSCVLWYDIHHMVTFISENVEFCKKKGGKSK